MSAFGTLTALTANAATLTNPGSAVQFMFIVNMDVAPLLLSFRDSANAVLGTIPLSAASAQDEAGGYLDSVYFPLFFSCDHIVLTSSVATAHVGTGSSGTVPAPGAGR